MASVLDFGESCTNLVGGLGACGGYHIHIHKHSIVGMRASKVLHYADMYDFLVS